MHLRAAATCRYQCIFQKRKDGVYVRTRTVSPSSLLSEIRSNLAMKFFDIIARIDKIRIDEPSCLVSVEGLDNQSTAVNQRLDRLIEALDNQSTAFNERLDRLIEARDDLSTVNKKLVKLIEAHDKQARAVNDRLDKVIELFRATHA